GDSFVIWSLPLTDVIQSITAVLTFTFLPRTKIDSGYYSDRGTLSHAFIVEKAFFFSFTMHNLFAFSPYILS
ncbi:unnamed protein product, partial [Rotaria sp. Silwood2]